MSSSWLLAYEQRVPDEQIFLLRQSIALSKALEEELAAAERADEQLSEPHECRGGGAGSKAGGSDKCIKLPGIPRIT